MTAASRRDSLAPSLFPFLAVLLCTMGALVLILMLLVAGAASSGKEAVKQIDEEMQWEQDKLQLVKNGLNEKYEEAKIELEKKRLVLQNYEQHIHELIQELEQLEKTSLQAEKKVDTEKETQKQRDELREALEKQLADAKKEVENKLKDPKGDKPIFAIIPYDGPNGTHRRPIYLECNSQGVVIQPEGVALSPVDLRPPYGPGNPLDAVLRTIRAEFPATNGAVTSNPYPLLVVRPSGIKHFMMARAAMSGWDDQFGYELVSEELELTFPPSVPKLEQKIASAIQLARERQAALVMAMPQHYRPDQLDELGAYGGSNASGGFADDSLDFGGGSGSRGSNGGSSSGSTGSSRRGGFSMGSEQAGAGGQPQNNLAQQGSATGGKGLSSDGTNGQLTMAQAASMDPSQTSSRQGLQPKSSGQSAGDGTMSFFGSSGSADDLLATGSGSGNQFRSKENAGGDLALGGGPSSGEPNSNGVTGSSSAQGAYSSSAGGSAVGSGASGGPNAGGQAGAAGSAGSAGPNMSGASSSRSASSNGQGSPPSNGGSSIEANPDSGQQGGISSLNMNFSKNQGESTKPIAQTRGRDWAWRDGNRSKTAVIRAIRLQCYSDRWVLLPDRGSNAAPAVISLDGPIVQKAEKLAEVVSNRVNNWGVAVVGGHWAPVIHVEVASDAEFRFQQLQRLMEGSGVDVLRKATIAPQSR